MITRSPLSAEGALTRVRKILGITTCANLLGVSTDMVYKRCTVEHARDLSFIDLSLAVAIDTMCKEKTGETPLLEYFQQRLEKAACPAIRETLTSAAIELASEVGTVEGRIHTLIEPSNRGPSLVSKREAAELIKDIGVVERSAERLKSIVNEASK